jgi:hypothetical protein
VLGHVLRWFTHHAKHGQATRADKASDEDRCQEEEDDIEDTGIVPLHPFGDRHHIAVRGNNTERYCLYRWWIIQYSFLNA